MLFVDRESVNAIAVIVVVLEGGRGRRQIQIIFEASLIGAFERPHPHFVVRIVGRHLVFEAGGVTDPQQHRFTSIDPEVSLEHLVAQGRASILNLNEKLMQAGFYHLK